MIERSNYESTERPGGLLTRNRVFQVLALSAALTACDIPKQTQDAGLQPTDATAGAKGKKFHIDKQGQPIYAERYDHVDDAGADKEDAEDECKLPPLDPELQKLAESHTVKVGYHDENDNVIYKELTLDEITGKNSMHHGCEDGSEEMLWSFIKHTRNKPKLQLEAIKRMTLSKSDLAIHIVTAEGMEEYKKKRVIVMGPPPIQ
jgi:hypothetical protein